MEKEQYFKKAVEPVMVGAQVMGITGRKVFKRLIGTPENPGVGREILRKSAAGRFVLRLADDT